MGTAEPARGGHLVILHLDIPSLTNSGGVIILPLLILAFLVAIALTKPDPDDADYED